LSILAVMLRFAKKARIIDCTFMTFFTWVSYNLNNAKQSSLKEFSGYYVSFIVENNFLDEYLKQRKTCWMWGESYNIYSFV